MRLTDTLKGKHDVLTESQCHDSIHFYWRYLSLSWQTKNTDPRQKHIFCGIIPSNYLTLCIKFHVTHQFWSPLRTTDEAKVSFSLIVHSSGFCPGGSFCSVTEENKQDSYLNCTKTQSRTKSLNKMSNFTLTKHGGRHFCFWLDRYQSPYQQLTGPRACKNLKTRRHRLWRRKFSVR